MNTRRSSFRSTLEALSQTFANGVILALCRAVQADLVGGARRVQVPAPETSPSSARKARTARTARRPTPSSPRAKPPLGLPIDVTEYPDTVIVDPGALLDAVSAPATSVVNVVPVVVLPSIARRPRRAPRRTPEPAPAQEETAAIALVPRAGEEVLRAASGAAVLRRRRVPQPPPAAAE